MADTRIAEAVKGALADVEIPGGGSLAGYGGLSDIIVTTGAVAFGVTGAISFSTGSVMEQKPRQM